MDKIRYNYFEQVDTLKELEYLAETRATTVSALIREATRKLLDDAPESQQPNPAQLKLEF